MTTPDPAPINHSFASIGLRLERDIRIRTYNGRVTVNFGDISMQLIPTDARALIDGITTALADIARTGR